MTLTHGIADSHTISLSDDDTVGIARIDGQHRLLFGLYNTLLDAVCGHGPGSHGDHVFTELFSYANYHFSSEEQLMRQALYPEYRTHMLEHRNLISTLEILGSRLERGCGETRMLAKFIGHWLLCHTRISDHDLGRYLRVGEAVEYRTGIPAPEQMAGTPA